MKLRFFGAARTVTGSAHLLEVSGSRVLLDCGLFQGRRKESFRRNREQPFDPASIDTLVLSHAHIDHSGNIPTLVKAGFRGRIVCTSATRDLCYWMLRDCGYIQEKDVEYVQSKAQKAQADPLRTPLHGRRRCPSARIVRGHPLRARGHRRARSSRGIPRRRTHSRVRIVSLQDRYGRRGEDARVHGRHRALVAPDPPGSRSADESGCADLRIDVRRSPPRSRGRGARPSPGKSSPRRSIEAERS